jgi:hypothetical protein
LPIIAQPGRSVMNCARRSVTRSSVRSHRSAGVRATAQASTPVGVGLTSCLLDHDWKVHN